MKNMLKSNNTCMFQGGFKGTVIMVPLKVHEANSAR